MKKIERLIFLNLEFFLVADFFLDFEMKSFLDFPEIISGLDFCVGSVMQCIEPFWDLLFSRCAVATQVKLLYVCRRVNKVGMTESNLMQRILMLKRQRQLENFPEQMVVEDVVDFIQNSSYHRYMDIVSEKKTRSVCLKMVECWGMTIKYVPNAKKTTEVCIEAIRKNGANIKYVPTFLQTPELCLAAVESTSTAVPYIYPCEYTSELCQAIIRAGGHKVATSHLAHIPSEFKTKKLCILVLQQRGSELTTIPWTMRDFDVCLLAVSKNWSNIQFVPLEHQTSEVCLAAIRESSEAIFYLHPDLN